MPKHLDLTANKSLFNSKSKSTAQDKYSLKHLTKQRNTANLNTAKLHQQSHIFIVTLGAIIGGIIAIAIGYSAKASTLNYFMLSLIPLSMSLILSKVYIHTVIHYKD